MRDGCTDCEVKGKDLRYDNLIFPAKRQAKPLIQVDRIKGILPWGTKKQKDSKQHDNVKDKVEPSKDGAKKGGSKKEKKGRK